MFSRFAAVLLPLNLGGILFGLWCALFGPGWGISFSIAGFFAGVVFVLAVFGNRTRDPGDSRPGLAQQVPALRRLRRPLEVLMVALVCVAALCLIGNYVASDSDGVGGFPVFEERASYELNSHGRRTSVSRTRYLVQGTCLYAGWNCGVAFLSVLSLYAVLFGSAPRWPRNRGTTAESSAEAAPPRENASGRL